MVSPLIHRPIFPLTVYCQCTQSTTHHIHVFELDVDQKCRSKCLPCLGFEPGAFWLQSSTLTTRPPWTPVPPHFLATLLIHTTSELLSEIKDLQIVTLKGRCISSIDRFWQHGSARRLLSLCVRFLLAYS